MMAKWSVANALSHGALRGPLEPEGEVGTARERYISRRPQASRRRATNADRSEEGSYLSRLMAAAQTREASVAAPRTGRDAGEMISELQAQMSVLVDGLHAAADVRTPWEREGPSAQPYQAPRETGERATHPKQPQAKLGMRLRCLMRQTLEGWSVL